ncbi:hypothetical protein [Capnocytophaga leadbetteri]
MNTGVKILLSIALIILASVVLTGIREAGGAGFIGSLLFFGIIFFGFRAIWGKKK